jgi:DNA replication initiation complex subunit (GINS family)
MGSRSNVQAQVRRAKGAERVEDKLNAIADAIYELADFIDDLENQLKRMAR